MSIKFAGRRRRQRQRTYDRLFWTPNSSNFTKPQNDGHGRFLAFTYCCSVVCLAKKSIQTGASNFVWIFSLFGYNINRTIKHWRKIKFTIEKKFVPKDRLVLKITFKSRRWTVKLQLTFIHDVISWISYQFKLYTIDVGWLVGWPGWLMKMVGCQHNTTPGHATHRIFLLINVYLTAYYS